MNFEPFRDNCFLLIDEKKRQTEGGLYIPDIAAAFQYGPKVRKCYVLKAGDGGMGYDRQTGEFEFFSVDVKRGDCVLIPWDAGQDCVVGRDILCSSAPQLEPGTEVRVVRNQEIIAVLG